MRPVTNHQASTKAPSRRAVVKHVAAPVAKRVKLVSGLSVQVLIVAVDDRNSNGFLEQNDTVTYGFPVVNTGQTTITDISVLDSRLSARKVAVTCPGTVLAPGQSMVCRSGPYSVTRFDEVHGVGVNSARARGIRPNGTELYSPRTTSTHGKTAVVDTTAPASSLAMTGSSIGSLGGLSLGLCLLGAGLCRLARRAKLRVLATG